MYLFRVCGFCLPITVSIQSLLALSTELSSLLSAFKTVLIEVAHFTFLFSRFYFLRQKIVSKSVMMHLCDVDVCDIVGKVSKRCFFIVAYDFHQNLHRTCANASFFTIL